MDARKRQLEQELGDCVLNSSWFFVSAAGPAAGLVACCRCVVLLLLLWHACRSVATHEANPMPPPCAVRRRGCPGCAAGSEEEVVLACGVPGPCRWVPVAADAWELGIPVRLGMHVHPSKHVPCKAASHSGLVTHGAGTLLDLINGYDKCKAQRQALESYMRR